MHFGKVQEDTKSREPWRKKERQKQINRKMVVTLLHESCRWDIVDVLSVNICIYCVWGVVLYGARSP